MALGDGNIGEGEGEMAASYVVEITGIQRARDEVARLSQAIHALRVTDYSGGSGPSATTISRGGGNENLFTTQMDSFEGRVQGKVISAVDSGVKAGRDAQEKRLDAAVTPYGIQRMAGRAGPRNSGGNSDGRNKTGAMIKALKTNVEIVKTKYTTRVTGWHGWANSDKQEEYFRYQEKGTYGRNVVRSVSERRSAKKASRGNGGIEAANSLGAGILIAREEIKKGLGEI